MSKYVKRPLAWLARRGVRPNGDPIGDKRVMLANQFAMTFGLLPVPFLFVNRGLAPAISDVVTSSFYLSVLVFNHFGWTRLGRFAFVAWSYLGIFGTTLLFGNEARIWTFFFPACCYPILLFGWNEKRLLFSGLALNAALMLGSQWYFIQGGRALKPMVPMPTMYPLVITSIGLFVFIIAMIYATRGGNKAEAALGEAVEAAKAADKAKSRFLANMSHEIRTPLNGILGLSDLLSRSELGRKGSESVEAIRSSAQDLLNIINDILDLSKIEAGKMRMESIPFAVRKLPEGLRQLFEPLAQRKGLDLRLEVHPSVPARAIGDPVRIKQILNNLIGNAIKFTERGYVSLRVTQEARPEENIVRLRFEVEDTGVGIPQAAQARLFNAFSQADDSTTRKFGGTGLGLHLCRQMAEMMGGAIGFTSREGEGSRFWFIAPLASAPGEPEAEPSRDGESQRLPEGIRVLIVDDHPVNRRVLEAMLESRGCRPQKAADGLEALEAVRKEGGFDLILMDSHMPRMDGFECTRRLRDTHVTTPDGRKPVIIGFTADAMAGSREKCLEAGMDDMITKPILEQDLNRALNRWVDVPALRAAHASPARGEWIDAAQIAEMNQWISQYEPSFWDKTLRQFDISFRDLSGSVRAACQAGDFHAAGIAAHTLKGACVMLGMRRLGEICNSLEALGMGGEPANWPGLLEALEASRKPSLEELRKWI